MPHGQCESLLCGGGKTAFPNKWRAVSRLYEPRIAVNLESAQGKCNRGGVKKERLMYHDMGFGWMGWSWILLALVVAVVVYLAVRLAQQKEDGRGGGRGESPMDILKKRYARGEISREEFERIKKDLS